MDVGAGRAANKSLRCGLQGVREHFKSSGDIHSLCEAADGQDCKEGQAADLWQSVEYSSISEFIHYYVSLSLL